MSVYKVIELVGTSTTSWEDAAAQAVKTASETLHDLGGRGNQQDIHVDEGGAITFRTKLSSRSSTSRSAEHDPSEPRGHA